MGRLSQDPQAQRRVGRMVVQCLNDRFNPEVNWLRLDDLRCVDGNIVDPPQGDAVVEIDDATIWL